MQKPVRLLPRGSRRAAGPPDFLAGRSGKTSLELDAFLLHRRSLSGASGAPERDLARAARQEEPQRRGQRPAGSRVGPRRPNPRFSQDPARPSRCALGPPWKAVPAVPGDAVLPCTRAGPGSNLALKIGATEQLRAGKAGAPAVQHLSVRIKICKAEASAPRRRGRLSAWCVIGVNCLIGIIATVWGSGFQARRDRAGSAGSWPLISPLGAPATPLSSTHCSRRPAGLGLRGTPRSLSFPSREREVRVGGEGSVPPPHQHNPLLHMEGVGAAGLGLPDSPQASHGPPHKSYNSN